MEKVRIVIIVLSSFLFQNLALYSNWNDISPQGRKERIYSLDIPTKQKFVSLARYSTLFDTIFAVGWSSTTGTLFSTFDGGKKWNIYQLSSLFPFSVKFLNNSQVVVCGYNYIFDDAEVRFFDLFGNQINSFEFNGESLPYSKNFFDCLVDSLNILFCGYGNSIYRYSLSEHSWQQHFVDSNQVFLKLKKFDFKTQQGDVSLGFLLGGKSYQNPTRLYYSNPELSEWNFLFDCNERFPAFELSDFYFTNWDFENNFPDGFLVGTIDDTIAILRSKPNERTFEFAFKQQNIEQPVGVFAFNQGENVVVLLSNGAFIVSGNGGVDWEYKFTDNIPKQVTGGLFFNFESEELLPDVIWRKLDVLAFGIDGTIQRYNGDYSLSVEAGNNISDQNCDEVEVYDFLGRLIYKTIDTYWFDKNFVKGLSRGVYFVVKKAKGNPCKSMIYIFF